MIALPKDEHGNQQFWRCLTLDATDDQARTAFRNRYGYEAAEVHRGSVIVYAGPVRGNERWTTTETRDTVSTACAA